MLTFVPRTFATQRITIRQNQNVKQDALKDNKRERERSRRKMIIVSQGFFATDITPNID